MKQNPCYFTKSTLIFILLFFISLPAQSSGMNQNEMQSSPNSKTNSASNENYLNKARLKLGNAFDNYRKGDMLATKKNLNDAAEWLNKAAQNSSTEKARDDARQLATEIDKFKETVNAASAPQENDLARFWHRTTSIIIREADQLVHSYVTLSTDSKTLKYLLDAKTHLFTAEHDLFVSHEATDAAEELDKVISYLKEAAQVSRPAIKNKITELNKDIQFLKKNIETKKGAWKNDSVIHALDKAAKNLTDASKNASPTVKLKIDMLETNIHELRQYVETNNVKNNYDASMAKLKNIINGL